MTACNVSRPAIDTGFKIFTRKLNKYAECGICKGQWKMHVNSKLELYEFLLRSSAINYTQKFRVDLEKSLPWMSFREKSDALDYKKNLG